MEGGELLWVCAQGAASPSGKFGSSLCIPGMDMEAGEKGEWSREVRMLHLPEAEGCLWPQDAADSFQGADFGLGVSQPQGWQMRQGWRIPAVHKGEPECE